MLPGWPEPTTAPPPREEAHIPKRRRHRILAGIVASIGTLLVVATVVAALVRLPYNTIAPGSTYVVNDLVNIRGQETFPADGEVLYTTVSVRERVSALQALLGWLDPTVDVVPEEEIRGNLPPDQYRQLNLEAMNDSKTTAEVLALGRIGYTDLGVGAEIESVGEGSPAAGVLKPEDVLVQIDGKPIKTSGDAVVAIRAHQPGETVSMRVRRGGSPLDLTAGLARAEDGGALLGVRLSTKTELPFEITINSGEVVGPSAGLAYALELLDVLTPGELTGGVKVAATGELAPNGDVGPVGGIAQKVVTVKRAGAKVFLVPEANEAEARSHAGSGLQIRGVSNFDDALTELGAMQGSNALALARTGSPGA